MDINQENAAIVAWLLEGSDWNDCARFRAAPSYINVEFNIDSTDGDLRQAILREIRLKDGAEGQCP